MIDLLIAAWLMEPADKSAPAKGRPDKDSEAPVAVEPETDVATDAPAPPVWTIPASMRLMQDGCSGPIELANLSYDAGTIKYGTATVFCASGSEPLRGRVTGTLADSGLRLLIDWGCVKRPWPLSCVESAGMYEGVVNSEGWVTGTTYDIRNSGSRAAWRSLAPLPRQ